MAAVHCTLGILDVLQGILLAMSAVLYPITYQLWDPPMPWRRPPRAPPSYDTAMEERIGYSLSWKYSLQKGYHVRSNYWHYYGLTLTGLWQSLGVANCLSKSKQPPTWFTRRSAALALSVGAPLPDPPYVHVVHLWR